MIFGMGDICSCVRLNADLGIYDLVQQAAARREGVNGTVGMLVGASRSAVKDCRQCGGTGDALFSRLRHVAEATLSACLAAVRKQHDQRVFGAEEDVLRDVDLSEIARMHTEVPRGS